MTELKLGKLPARPGAVRFAQNTYFDEALPAPPPAHKAHQSLVHLWGMLGNDRAGDCVFAGAAHETMLWVAETGETVPFTDDTVLADYTAVTGFNPEDPTTDQGTDMQVAASYRRKVGVLDGFGRRHLVAAYLGITAADKATLKQAVYRFTAVGIGIRFPRSAMAQFNNGRNWTVQAGSPIVGGHYIPAVGYDSRYVYVITWGRVQKMTWGFFAKYCDESIAYLSTEMLSAGKSLEGFNLGQLRVDLARLPAA